MSANLVSDIVEDNQGVLWIGTDKGLNRLDLTKPVTKSSFTHFKHKIGDSNSLSANDIERLFKDSNGTLWIGTLGGGLNRYHPQQQNFSHFKHQPEDSNSLGGNRVLSIQEDNQGGLWIGSRTAGLSKITPQRQVFGHVKHHSSDPNSLSNNAIRAIYKDDLTGLWVGTIDGLNHSSNQAPNQTPNQAGTPSFVHFKHQALKNNSLSFDFVLAIIKDAQHQLWIGTDYGLNRYNPASGQFSHFKHQPSNLASISDNTVLSLFEDSEKNLWIGTWNGGLNRYDSQTQTFEHFKHNSADPNSLSSNTIRAIEQDSLGNLWIGTFTGLNRLQSNFDGSSRFISYLHQPSDPYSLSHNTVLSIYNDSKGTLWIGTRGGLNKFNPLSNQFTHYREKHGLPNNVVYDILEDEQGLLWLSTNKGLSRFDSTTETFRNYDVNDGLQSNGFSLGASFKAADGELFFGGFNGFNRFFPENIQDDTEVPTVVFTDFLLANQPVSILRQSPTEQTSSTQTQFSLSKAINKLDHLILTHQQDLVTFEFAALHFINPMKNQYAYRLEGLNEDWIYTDANNRRATYTQLHAGDYTLHIKASNHHGYWNEQGRSLKITVLPPLWQTWWAYTLYALLLLALVLTLLMAFVRTQRNKVLYERSVIQRLTEVDKLKDEFLANTSHELRTPLNGIIGLAESLMDGIAGPMTDTAKHNLAMVVSSGRRLSNLVNDILDFSKLKNRHLVLTRQAVDLHSLVEVVLALSKPLVGNKSLVLINAIDKDFIAADADENRLMQILHNLVGNAIKFTEQGSITLCATLSPSFGADQTITISVSDTGIGIEPALFDNIFDSFEQLDGHTERSQSGTGLGLAVSKQLVELHGGTITVQSVQGEGSTFSFTLLTCSQLAHSGEKSHRSQAISRLNTIEADIQVTDIQTTAVEALTPPKTDGFRILVVDDEPINRQVINNLLSLQNYQLTEACGGEEALIAMRNDGPFDLVLLDIMMPKISGYDVCQQLREIWPVNDLPVIFLTAKNQVADLVQSFAMGGNDYLTKPVIKHELLARVENQLKMLDINRNLEQKVAQRTEQLQQSLEQLTTAQQQLLEAQKMASMGNLVAGVAHEINTPLGTCITLVSLHLDQLKIFNQQMAAGNVTRKLMDSYLAKTEESQVLVQTNLHRVDELIQSFKKVAVGHSDDNCVDVVFHDRLTDIINSLKPTLNPKYSDDDMSVDSGIQITLVSRGQWSLNTYPEAWWQILSILVENSLNHGFFNKTAGQITISAALKSAPGPADKPVEGKINSQYLVLIYRDDGHGMDDTQKDNIYEPFYTTTRIRGNTGLGMHIVYNLVVQKLGGEIRCQSELTQGVEFVIEVPTGN